MGRIPFEMAPPGTDPTKQRNRVMMRSGWRQALPWIAIALAFAFLGYVLLGGRLPRIGKRPAQSAAEQPTAAPTATETAMPTLSPTETPTERATTPEPPKVTVLAKGEALVRYVVGDITCTCDVTADAAAWGDDQERCEAFKPEVCDG